MARRGYQQVQTKEQWWRQLLHQWQHSGQTVRDFCAQHGVSQPSFYAWRRTIAQRDQRTPRSPQARDARYQAPAPRTPGQDRDLASPRPLFVPVGVTEAPLTPAGVDGSLEVVLGLGRVVRVPPGFDAATLRQLLAVLEGPSC